MDSVESKFDSDVTAGAGNKQLQASLPSLSPSLCASHREGGCSFSLHLPNVSAALLTPTQMCSADVCGQVGLSPLSVQSKGNVNVCCTR